MLYFIGGIAFSKGQRALVQWMDEEGKATNLLRGFDWDKFDAAGYSEEMANRLLPPIVDFIKTKTKQEMLEFALSKGLVCAPISSVKDIIESPQLTARDYWERIYHPDLNVALAYPGAPCKSTEPLWQVTQHAPLVGEHNEEIYGQLGLSQEEIAALKGKGTI